MVIGNWKKLAQRRAKLCMKWLLLLKKPSRRNSMFQNTVSVRFCWNNRGFGSVRFTVTALQRTPYRRIKLLYTGYGKKCCHTIENIRVVFTNWNGRMQFGENWEDKVSCDGKSIAIYHTGSGFETCPDRNSIDYHFYSSLHEVSFVNRCLFRYV